MGKEKRTVGGDREAMVVTLYKTDRPSCRDAWPPQLLQSAPCFVCPPSCTPSTALPVLLPSEPGPEGPQIGTGPVRADSCVPVLPLGCLHTCVLPPWSLSAEGPVVESEGGIRANGHLKWVMEPRAPTLPGASLPHGRRPHLPSGTQR